MDSKAIDKSLIEIIEKKAELNALTYDDKGYDKIEDELHDLEDEFIEKILLGRQVVERQYRL